MSPRDLVAPFLETRLGWPRVDWARAAVATGADGSIPLATWNDLVVGWIEHVVDAKGQGGRWSRGANFHLVELPGDERAHHALRWAQEIQAFLLRYLDGIVEPHASPLPLLLFVQQSDYIDWHADFESNDAGDELASSGGMFINGPCPHIAAPLGLQLESTLAHELTHAVVRHLPLPAWLNEGFAVAMAGLWSRHVLRPSSYDLADHRRLWNTATIQRFWSGHAFRDHSLQMVAYQLAHVLVTRLAGNYDRLYRFANAATFADAGAAAFAATYGEPISRLLVPMLGLGPWQPDPVTW